MQDSKPYVDEELQKMDSEQMLEVLQYLDQLTNHLPFHPYLPLAYLPCLAAYLPYLAWLPIHLLSLLLLEYRYQDTQKLCQHLQRQQKELEHIVLLVFQKSPLEFLWYLNLNFVLVLVKQMLGLLAEAKPRFTQEVMSRLLAMKVKH